MYWVVYHRADAKMTEDYGHYFTQYIEEQRVDAEDEEEGCQCILFALSEIQQIHDNPLQEGA